MNISFKLELPNFNEIAAAIHFKDEDWAILGRIIVDGMAFRIRNEGVTANGQPLSENSRWWTAQKLRGGFPARPLEYTGGLSRPETYQMTFEGDTMTIQLIPSYTEIHLNLIEISQATGKNYMDWFGIAVEDIDLVQHAALDIVIKKLKAVMK